MNTVMNPVGSILRDPQWLDQIGEFIAAIEQPQLTPEDEAEILAFARMHRGWVGINE